MPVDAGQECPLLIELVIETEGQGLRHMHVDVGIGVEDPSITQHLSRHRTNALEVQAIFEIDVDLARVTQAQSGSRVRGINDPQVGAIAPVMVLVLQLAVRALEQS
ncbi:hypothetical protein D3C76_847800 [compost metagenome]